MPIRSAALLTLVLIGAVAIPALAVNTVTTTITLPFSGSFYDTVTAEWVNIAGNINITSHVTLSSTLWTLALYTALPANVTGTGQTSGARYIANGAGFLTIQVPTPQQGLVYLSTWQATIFPLNDPDLSSPAVYGTVDNFVVTLKLEFAGNGSLIPPSCPATGDCTGSSVASIGEILVSCDPSAVDCR